LFTAAGAVAVAVTVAVAVAVAAQGNQKCQRQILINNPWDSQGKCFLRGLAAAKGKLSALTASFCPGLMGNPAQ
jgi:hypothetical protein